VRIVFGSDAQILARLADAGTVGADPDRDLIRISPGLRPLAERLLAASPDDRQAIWDDFVGGRFGNTPATRSTAARKSDAPERGVRMTCAVDLEPREVEWLWPGRVPLGMITMFAGDPKLGKSLVTLAIAAALSRGLPLPPGGSSSLLGSTLLMSAEDDAARTIRRRLSAAGADLAKIHILESVVLANGSEALPSLRLDVDAIAAAAARLGDCRLIVIDPVASYLKGVDDNRNAVLRGVLSPLKTLAERLDVAVILVHHLTKAASANRKHRVSGSIAYVGACRANYLFVPDPEDRTGRRVLMLDNGGNIAPAAPALAYTIEDPGDGPRVVWSDESPPIILKEAIPLEQDALRRRETDDLNECGEWLRGALAGGRVLAADLRRAGEEVGFPWPTLSRARSRVGATTRREGFGPGSKCYWQLRHTPKHESAATIDLTSVP
jgi:hypothetical protein